MNPIVIVGKGRSASWIPSSERYEVAAVSEAIRLCERCDFLAINDVAAWDSLEPEEIHSAHTLILPTYLHADPRGRTTVPHEKVHRYLRDVILYELPTAPEHREDVPKFGRCWSTTESLVAYLLMEGYREFWFSGVEKDGTAYHPKFKPRTIKKERHFVTNWKRVVKRIDRADGKVRLWNEVAAS